MAQDLRAGAKSKPSAATLVSCDVPLAAGSDVAASDAATRSVEVSMARRKQSEEGVVEAARSATWAQQHDSGRQMRDARGRKETEELKRNVNVVKRKNRARWETRLLGDELALN
jgi:hypothetical protein